MYAYSTRDQRDGYIFLWISTLHIGLIIHIYHMWRMFHHSELDCIVEALHVRGWLARAVDLMIMSLGTRGATFHEADKASVDYIPGNIFKAFVYYNCWG